MALLQVKSNAQIDEDAAKDRAKVKELNQPKFATELAAYISTCFEAAKDHRETEGITDRLNESARQKKGMYSATKIAAINKQGGSRLYFNITDTKAEAVEAWLQDVLVPVGDRPWAVQPTPIPDLGDDRKDEVVEQMLLLVQDAQDQGQELTPEDYYQFAAETYDKMLKDDVNEAKERAARMEQKMADQLIEGDFFTALDAFKQRLATFQLAIMKGPVIKKKRRLTFVKDPISGVQVPEVVEDQIPTWCAPSPHDFYPGPSARNVEDAYICEVVHLNKKQLSDLRGVDGYNTKAIEALLNANSLPKLDITLPGNDEREDIEDIDTDETNLPDSTLQAIEFWGPARGSVLKAWGMKGIDDDNRYYDICGILAGTYVIKAILNPSPLGQKPYYICGFINSPDSIWGTSLPEKMKDCQDMVNACGRNMANNIAVAAGPQVSVDIGALPPGVDPTKIHPMKVWQYYGDKTPGRLPINFFQPTANANELLAVMSAFETRADDRTMVPRYSYGNQDAGGGAAETASGLSMLMNAASKGIKRLVGEVDRLVLRPLLYQLYVWNMLYLDNDKFGHLKGDVQIVPKGALAMLLRDQTLLRQQEFLNFTNNPTDMQIIGMEGRANVLRRVAARLDIDPDKVVPDEATLRQRVQDELDQQMAMQELAATDGPQGGKEMPVE